jgi:hypothetical protein
MGQFLYPRAVSLARRVGVLLCILLIFFVGVVAAAHVHTRASALPDRSCSACALAHAGVAPVELSSPVPVFASTALAETPTEISRSLLFIPSLYIRPPPAV